MAKVDKKLADLFAEYEKAFDALDLEKNAHFFADTFMAAGPTGSNVGKNDATFRETLRKGAENYRRIGQKSAKILALTETPISDEYSLVKVHWGVTFAKTGDKVVEFDVSYLIEKTTAEPKIILSISHEDEQKALAKLGLTPTR